MSTEAQGSGHNDGDDDAASIPHVPSNDSVAAEEDGIEVVALDSPTTAARKVHALSCVLQRIEHVLLVVAMRADKKHSRHTDLTNV